METLRNKQYEDFILQHVIRPYQHDLEVPERIERLAYTNCGEGSFNYYALWEFAEVDIKWFSKIIVRLSKIYTSIDFSFFPNEKFATRLKSHLLEMGVKEFRKW